MNITIVITIKLSKYAENEHFYYLLPTSEPNVDCSVVITIIIQIMYHISIILCTSLKLMYITVKYYVLLINLKFI